MEAHQYARNSMSAKSSRTTNVGLCLPAEGRSFMRRQGVAARRGAALIEAALVLPVFLFIILGSLDLSLAVFRYNSLSAAARRLAREAVVHGTQAPPQASTWGPTTVTATGADSSEVSRAVQPYLPTFNPKDVQLQIDWLDGDCQPDHRVRVTLSYPQRSIAGSLFGYGLLSLQAASTMRILH